MSHRWVTPQYFRTMGIPLLRGRDVEDGDTGDRAWVAVVSASFVERYWPGQDPIGRTFGTAGKPGPSSAWSATSRSAGWNGPASRRCTCPHRRSPTAASANFDPKDLVIRHSGQGDSARLRRPPDRPRGRSRAADLRRAHDGRGARGRHGDPARAAPGAGRAGGCGRAALRRRHLRAAGLHGRRSDRRRSACVSRWARSRRAWAA